MLKVVDEDGILKSWEDLIRITNISPDVIDLHKKVISSKDFLAVMKTDQWKNKMKKMVLKNSVRKSTLFRH